MTREQWRANWDDQMAQQYYAIYEQGEEVGLILGHDAEHATSKFAQYQECDPASLQAELAWPHSEGERRS